jgi:hypothetical protein
MKPTPTISKIEKEFDNLSMKYVGDGGWGAITDNKEGIGIWPVRYEEVKLFYRQQILSILEGLKGEEQYIKNEYNEGFNQAIKEQNDKIERASK